MYRFACVHCNFKTLQFTDKLCSFFMPLYFIGKVKNIILKCKSLCAIHAHGALAFLHFISKSKLFSCLLIIQSSAVHVIPDSDPKSIKNLCRRHSENFSPFHPFTSSPVFPSLSFPYLYISIHPYLSRIHCLNKNV